MSTFTFFTLLKDKLKKRIYIPSIEIFPLSFSPYLLNQEKSYTYIVNKRTDDTLVIGRSEAELIQKWRQGNFAIEEIEENNEFIQTLLDNNFITKCSKYQVYQEATIPKPQLRKLSLQFLRPFVIPFLILESVVIVFAIVCVLQNFLALTPTFHDFFWTPDVFDLYLGSFALSYILALIHEAAHFVSSKAFGIESRINLFAVRINQLVSETEHYFIYSLKKHERIIIYLSGLITDITLAALLLILINFNFIPTQLIPLSRYIVLVQLLAALWQLNVFFKTDVYNALSDTINQPNLYEESMRYIQLKMSYFNVPKSISRFIMKIAQTESFDEYISHLDASQMRNVKGFSHLFFVGILQSVVLMIFVTVPRDIVIITNALQTSLNATSYEHFFKGLFIAIVISWAYVITAVLNIRKMQK